MQLESVAGREVVHVETVAEPAERHLLRADRRVAALAFAADGDEVLLLLEDGRGVRRRRDPLAALVGRRPAPAGT